MKHLRGVLSKVTARVFLERVADGTFKGVFI